MSEREAVTPVEVPEGMRVVRAKSMRQLMRLRGLASLGVTSKIEANELRKPVQIRKAKHGGQCPSCKCTRAIGSEMCLNRACNRFAQ